MCDGYVNTLTLYRYLSSLLTIEHMYSDTGHIRVGGGARILARVGQFGVLYQQIGGCAVALFRDHRNAAPLRIVANYLRIAENRARKQLGTAQGSQ